MSEKQTTENVAKSPRTGLMAAVGIVIVLGILVAVNIIAGFLSFRLDLTEDKIYTLSEGSKNILSELDTPVTIRYYVSDDKSLMPAEVRTMAPRVENFLMEYRKASGGEIRVEKILVKPDSDEEDSANLDGIQPQGMLGQDPLYFGLSIGCLDKKVAIPFIHPGRETLLEYDLSRAVTQVVDPDRPKIAILTSLEVAGGFGMGQFNMSQGPKAPWHFHSELSRDYEVEMLTPDVTEIPEDAAVTVVLHPFDITPDAEKAIDQYLLKGGNVVALLDPMFFHSRALSPPQQNPMAPSSTAVGPSSTFSRLFDAWGLKFNVNDVLVDNRFRSPIGRGQVHPAVLTLTEEAINRDDVVTAQLQDIRFAFAGAFTGEPAEGLTKEVLVHSSAENQFVTPPEAELGPGVQKLLQEFASSGIERPLVVRLRGKFKSAYASDEEEEGAEEKQEEGEDKKAGGEEDAADEAPELLKEATAEGTLVLFSDADFIYDALLFREQNVLGQRILIPLNQNLSLFHNVVEQLAGNQNLIAVRSRASTRRPFTKINEIEAAAESRYRDEIDKLEKDVQDTQDRLTQLQGQKDESQRFVLSPEQQQEIADMNLRVAERNKELRQVRKDLRKDIDSLIARLKFVNIASMPILVLAIGIILALGRRAKRAAR